MPLHSKWGNLYGASACLLGIVGGWPADVAMCIYNVGRECYNLPFPKPPDRRRRGASLALPAVEPSTEAAVIAAPARARRATSALFDARALQVHTALGRYANQLNLFTSIWAGDVIVFNSSKASINPAAAEWLGLNDSAWVASAAASSSDSSPAVRPCDTTPMVHACPSAAHTQTHVGLE